MTLRLLLTELAKSRIFVEQRVIVVARAAEREREREGGSLTRRQQNLLHFHFLFVAFHYARCARYVND